jgi:hypothetical protein
LNSEADHSEEREPHLIDSAFSLVTDEFFKVAYNELAKEDIVHENVRMSSGLCQNSHSKARDSSFNAQTRIDDLNTSITLKKDELGYANPLMNRTRDS